MLSIALAAVPSAGVVETGASCPKGTTQVDTFTTADRVEWSACEDLAVPGGGITLVPASGSAVHLPKSYEPYSPEPDDHYYLGLGKAEVLAAKWDMLGDAILNQCSAKTSTTGLCEPTWERVERAVPVMRYSQGNKNANGNNFMCSPYSPESGVRTFTGSRSASVDATFSDHADDCTDNGFPRPQGYVMNLTAIAAGEPPIHDFLQYVNFSAMAEGMVGGLSGGYPNLIFYFPIQTQNFSSFGGSRYWTMIASPVPDMQGGREQSVWFRFQQLRCAGAAFAPPCELLGQPQYYDTYWYSFSPITSRWIRPELQANASGFYSNLLAVKAFWDAELAAEGMMSLRLPATATTNGTFLAQQARFALVRSMISRDDTWHPRYGVIPGYGITLQDGFEDTFTATATGAVEWGSLPYARGVIDNWLRFYVRDNGMVTYRAEELAQSGRMLTIFALYVDVSGDEALMLQHFGKARALARWLLYRYELSLQWPDGDPRRGIVAGGDEGDGFVAFYESYGDMTLEHKYSCASNTYRGFVDIGELWRRLGAKTGRADLAAHADELLAAAPQLLSTLQASLKRTTWSTGNPRAPRCVPTGADVSATEPGSPPTGCLGDFRGIPELMYSAVLTREQTDDLFTYFMYANDTRMVTRPTTLGCAGYNNKCSTYTAYGMAYGLLAHDMVERFLLHYFGFGSAHAYTRGTFTTPEASHPDRDVGSTDYVAAGVMMSPTYLKWMLLFEDPNTRTVWLAKALPREWLAKGAEPVEVLDATTRYGRVSYTLRATDAVEGADGAHAFSVTANVTLPSTYADAATAPPGGVRLRLRAPVALAGRLAAVTVGGKPWKAFNATAETVDFGAKTLTPALLVAMQSVVATWAA